MAARGSKSTQQARTEAERVRLYAARTTWHNGQIRRRVRDNTIAVIAGVLLIAGAIFSQVLHAQATAPAPEPTPSLQTPETPAPSESPVPSDSPAPEPESTDAPAE